MAILTSEDEQIKSSFELIFLKEEEKRSVISWINYKLVLKSADKELIFESKENNKGAEDYVFALKPINEIENLIDGIKAFLENKNSDIFSFEPIEPSFEIILERSHKGYSMNLWVDAGNVISDHYTWDGFGMRFFTSQEKLDSFVSELNKEKEGLLLNC